LDQTFLRKIAIGVDGVLTRVTKLKAMGLKMMEMALKGNVKAAMALFGLAKEYGKFEPEKRNIVQIQFVDADPAQFKKLIPELDDEK
jgi:hypothetical protein